MSPGNLTTIRDLKMDSHNPRKHGERNLQQIEQSLKNFGAGRSIVIDEQNEILAGNGLIEAAGNIGLSKLVVVDATGDEIVAVRRRGLTAKQKSEYRIADNRSAELAEWDIETLEAMSQEIDLEQFWDVGELEELLGREPNEEIDAEPQIDRAAELLEKWKVERGQVWQLGEHRLMCGDSTKAGDVARLLDGDKPFIMVTDPPYGVEYDPKWRNEAAAKGLIAFAASRQGLVSNDDRVDWTEAYKLFPGIVAYVWHADRHAADLVVNLRASGFEIRTQIIWKKPAFAISRGHYHWQHEPCWYAVKDGSSKWCGDRSQSTVWDISNRQTEHTDHGTQKPVECMARPIRNHGGKDDDVYDPFVGSGTTIIAAEQLNRRCFTCEIEPKYVAVCLQRFLDATGKQPSIIQ